MKNAAVFYIFVFAAFMYIYSIPVFAEEYIVTVSEGADIDEYDIKPLFKDAGIFITDKETADKLYSKGLTSSVEEDKPLEIPEEEAFDALAVSNNDNELIPMSNDYNDTYYNEELYFEQAGIKNYIDTYKPDGKVRVAVIDTGINRQHQDFANSNIETGYNFVTNNTDTTDLFRHGTMVASIIAAGANDGCGVAGIAPNATIVPLVAMTKVNNKTVGTTQHLIRAINSAVDEYNCKIITTSLGVTSGEGAVNTAVKYALSKGVIVISAAGNSGSSSNEETASQLSYPASSPGAISVGATDANYNRADYSQKNTRVDVVAYGGTLTMPSNTNTSSYVRASGTSFSCPVIAGITALYLSNHPDITPEEYGFILKAAAMDIGLSGGEDYMGYGMPDCMAMERIYNDSSNAFIAPIYDNSAKRNIKIASDGTINDGLLVAACFNKGIMSDYKLIPITFNNYFAYVNTETTDNSTVYFLIDSLDRMKSLSAAVEY